MANKKLGRIILLGYMGSGKSTVGKALAHTLDYLFIDTDTIIETLKARLISDYFSSGEEVLFRAEERNILGHFSDINNYILSTGGGLPIYNDNIDVLNQLGHTVYLKCSPKELYSRLRKDDTERPLHSNKGQDLLDDITKRLEKRSQYYEKANIIIDGDLQPDNVVQSIMTRLSSL